MLAYMVTRVMGCHMKPDLRAGWKVGVTKDDWGAQDEHELDARGSAQLSEGTPRHWRLRAQQLGVLAFDRLRVCPLSNFGFQ